MSDRELRDEVEALFAELRREREKLETPFDPHLTEERAALSAHIGQLTTRAEALRARREVLRTLIRDRELETKAARAELETTRAEIGRRESVREWWEPPPLPRPQHREGEREPAGCSVMVWLLMGGALTSAAGWWLR